LIIVQAIAFIACVAYMYVAFFSSKLPLTTRRFVKRIPDPLTGPKGVRTLLVVRGITGYVMICLSSTPDVLMVSSWFRFIAICGMYWSLQYLSVADATVLTFLKPLTTALAGWIFLKEGYSIKQGFAAGGSDMLNFVDSLLTGTSLVCSLLGVVLIARPPFLFGSPTVIPVVPEATPAERLMGVG
jgi:drug/metabolite transporter (DMT)-like permease